MVTYLGINIRPQIHADNKQWAIFHRSRTKFLDKSSILMILNEINPYYTDKLIVELKPVHGYEFKRTRSL